MLRCETTECLVSSGSVLILKEFSVGNAVRIAKTNLQAGKFSSIEKKRLNFFYGWRVSLLTPRM